MVPLLDEEATVDDEDAVDDDAAPPCPPAPVPPPVPLALVLDVAWVLLATAVEAVVLVPPHVAAPHTEATWLTHWVSQLLVQQYESAEHIAAAHASQLARSAPPVEQGE